MKKLLLLLSFFICLQGMAQPTMTFNLLRTDLGSAVDAVPTIDGSNRLFIVQQSGSIRIIQNGVLKPQPFLTITSGFTTGGERGLLSLAFHPGYATNRYFFVYYTNATGAMTVARGRTSVQNSDSAEAGLTVLLSIPRSRANHNGGRLQFGSDGFLYFGTGDSGGGGDPDNTAQNGNSLQGKMLRIDVNGFATAAPFYSIPASNPFVTNPNIADEIIGLGLRNPFRWSFDKATGNMWIGDVGQNAREEVNFATPAQYLAGLNYGWRCYEGELAFNTTGCQPQTSYFAPVFTYDRNATTGGVSITGGMVFRNTNSPLNGRYICSDYGRFHAWLLTPATGGGFTASRQAGLPNQITSFSQSEDSIFYCTTLVGELFSISAGNVLPMQLEQFSARLEGNFVRTSALVSAVEAGDMVVLEQVGRNHTETVATEIISQASQRRSFAWAVAAPKVKTGYRVRLESKNSGRTQFSQIVEIDPKALPSIRALVQGRQLLFENATGPFQWQLMDARGGLVAQQSRSGTGLQPLPGGLGAGLYYLVMMEKGVRTTQTIRLD